MRSFRRLLDRMTDRRPTLKASRSRRRRGPWRLVALLIAVLALIAAVLAWLPMDSPPRGRLAVVSTDASGAIRLDGQAVSLTELESRLAVLNGGETSLFVAIDGPATEGRPAMPPPEVAAVLARLQLNWMSMPDVEVELPHPPPPPPLTQEGDHGR